MSTRALRKLQREQEQERQLAAVIAEGEEEETAGSDEEQSIPSLARTKVKMKRKNKLNAYQMLEQGDEDEDVVPETSSDKDSVRPEANETSGISTPQSTKARSKKKKKKRQPKDKGKERDSSAHRKVEAEEVKKNTNEVDEIDRALQELDMRKGLAATQQDKDQNLQVQDTDTSWEKEISKLLAVDSKNLNPTNEMKSLFGSIALERTTHDQGRPDEEGRVDLETALRGRHSPASRGKELGTLAKRRNIFIQGQENWPLAASGGLGMEVPKGLEDNDSRLDSIGGFGKHYEIVHNSSYQDTQLQFRQAVESMSAEAMIHLLIYNPFHVATVLQVAEIAKHQGDHSVTGDLLERALFTFGRSVHSTFGVSIREGRARLGFDKTADRELYLAIWRYIQNLEMRGTWRTAFEWSKMLLSFNILSDPYGITHALDQYALRGRQHDALIELCSEEAFGNTWSHLPNMQISLGLAYHRASQPKLARQKLALAMHRYPYILSHLCSSLDISPLPKSLWGITPSTDAEKLYTELYVTRAKDLWATPETTALLVEVAETLDGYSQFWKSAPPAPKLEVSLEDARHILLLDIPALIALIPRNFRSLPTAQYDVLPPPSSTDDAGLTARAPAAADGPSQRGPLGVLAELMRAASRGFLGGGTATSASETNNNNHNHNHNHPNHLDEEDHEMNHQDLFNTTLADANLSEADRTAILSALVEDEDSDSDEYDEEEEEEEGPGPGDTDRILPHARTTNLVHRETRTRQYRDEDRPPPSFDQSPDIEPTQVRITPVPDREAPPDVDASLPPDQHTPRPRPTRLSPPPGTVPSTRVAVGRSAMPPAPTVEDETEDGEEGAGAGAGAGASGRRSPSAQPRQQPTPSPTSNPTTSPTPAPTTQTLQRYLLTAGLSNLQSNTPSPAAAMGEFTRRLRMLRHRDREWTLGVVRQRVGAGGGAGSGGGAGGMNEGEEFVQRIREALG